MHQLYFIPCWSDQCCCFSQNIALVPPKLFTIVIIVKNIYLQGQGIQKTNHSILKNKNAGSDAQNCQEQSSGLIILNVLPARARQLPIWTLRPFVWKVTCTSFEVIVGSRLISKTTSCDVCVQKYGGGSCASYAASEMYVNTRNIMFSGGFAPTNSLFI